ncbi:ABC transporter ATP-binding protein [Hoyosella sp. G463]|uniref:ABC transporter ATP-binding protein n=1 Tax=Lolliginicoccus lacisalsi TaxID=2742202 RepID=A0A927JBG1_9ACTN|nr:ABC transporter ATP-binding protein [Lolliginicoccus lacisalsi]MBD8506228.1 ABC transporter ATP-binding protein [Lolliginicoccus lacisalsi]
MKLAIDATALTKDFGRFTALAGLDLQVATGSIHGFLGPNGAGKSTTIRILLGLMRRTGGTVAVLGHDPATHALDIHRRTAYVPGDVAFWPSLTGGETLEVLARANPGTSARKRAELIERFRLDPRKRIRGYSKGNRQKIALISAFSASPDLLVLDEPTTGLDPLMHAEYARCVTAAAEQGTTVLLSSHILSEVDQLCDTTTIIRDGRTVQTGSLAELRGVARSHVIARTRARPAIDDADGITNLAITPDDGNHRTEFDISAPGLPAAINQLDTAGLLELSCTPPTLEDLFHSYYTSTGSDR